MKTRIVFSEQIAVSGRLDCWYYLAPGSSAIALLEKVKARGIKTICLGGKSGIAKVWLPKRFKRAYAADGEPSAPYLRPYDVFNYIPEPADWLSTIRTKELGQYQLNRGMILQTCSGRNLGPAVLVDAYLAKFLLSHDMIRIEIEDENQRCFVLAFLNSRTGRQMLRRDKTGSVIDHISDDHLAKMEVPVLKDEIWAEVVSLTRTGNKLREEARLKLDAIITSYEETLPPLDFPTPLCLGWAIKSETVEGRLDAAYYDPRISLVRQQLTRLGGKPVSTVAKVMKPAGRHKIRYVERNYGRPFLSGTQLLQSSPINLQFISPEIYRNISDFELHKGWIAYPADGRAEEGLGTPVLITEDREGWLASGHVGRVIPKTNVDVGWLFLALKTKHSQIQIKASASGSVVDSTFPSDLERVILPPQIEGYGEGVVKLWNDLHNAQVYEDRASALIDDALAAV